MVPTHEAGKGRWGQIRRLAFIDLRLQYEAKINRSDLVAFFGISVPQASQDLATYQRLANKNLGYDGSLKTYVALDTFTPLFGQTAATAYLDEIHRLATRVIQKDESFVGFLPSTGVVATPSRALDATEVARFVEAIRDKKCLDIEYQSMRRSTPMRRVIAPHALGFDGLRWHVRAFCHTKLIFRDFAMGRVRDLQPSAQVAADPGGDTDWNTEVTVVLVPHSGLSPAQRKAVIHDYGMGSSGKLELPCRKAMLFYTLRHLNLESPEISEDAARQHVVVKNRDEVDRWVREGAAG